MQASAISSHVRVSSRSRAAEAARAALSTTLSRHIGAATEAASPSISILDNESICLNTTKILSASTRELSSGVSAAPASSLTGGGNRVFMLGSGIGTDSSMIAANNRWNRGSTPMPTATFKSSSIHSRSFFTSSSSSLSRTKFSPLQQQPLALSTARALHASCHAKTNVSMDDEYGEMTTEGNTFTYPGPFQLESGQVLPRAELRYMTYGTLNEKRDNVLVICHALTGNASLHSWWGDLLGPGQAFDTSRYFIICANILGSCYGSTGPASPMLIVDNDDDGGSATTSPSSSSATSNTSGTSSDDTVSEEVYGVDFPDISVQDTVRLQLHMLQDELNISSVKSVIGGSFGGMQALEYAAQAGSIKSPFAVDDDDGRAVPFVRSVVPIACGARHTAWQIAISEVQRQAIYADPKWNMGNPSWDDPPLAGLSVARQIGMVSYRTAKGYDEKFGRRLKDEITPPYGSRAPWEVKSYLEYQGYKFLSRFDPVTYIKLTEQMDTHDVGRNRGGEKEALSSVHIPALVLGIDSDVLYPLHEQDELASLFPNGELKVIKSDAGHDGFLLEQCQVANYITEFLSSHY